MQGENLRGRSATLRYTTKSVPYTPIMFEPSLIITRENFERLLENQFVDNGDLGPSFDHPGMPIVQVEGLGYFFCGYGYTKEKRFTLFINVFLRDALYMFLPPGKK